MKTVEFLEALVPSDGIMFSAVPASFEKNNKTINYYKHTTCYDHHQLALACKVASKSQTNSFFALASFHQESYEDPSTGKKKQRTQENAKSLKCTWLDIDCGPGKPYADQREGLQALNRARKAAKLPKPTFIVSSGHGIHAYWAFTKDVPVRIWEAVAKRFKALMDAVGLRADKVTANAACILRPIGTHNYKREGDPREVKILAQGDAIRFSDWGMLVIAGMKLHHVPEPAERAPTSDLNSALGGGMDEYPPSDADRIADRCATLGAMRDALGADQDEQLWYSCIGVLRHTEQEEAVVQQWSSGHDSYDPIVTTDKMNQWGDLGPTTCDSMREVSEACKACTLKCRSPITLGFPDPVHQTEVSSAEVAVSGTGEGTEELAPVVEILPQLPDALAENYAWNEARGLLARVHDEDGNVVWVPICSQFPVPEFIFLDDDTDCYHVHCRVRSGPRNWLAGDLPLETVMKGGVTLMGAMGAKLAVTITDDGKKLVAFMKTWVNEIRKNTDLQTMCTQMGWQKDGSFLLGHRLYCSDGSSRDIVVSKSIMRYADAHTAKGSLDRQIELINRAYNKPNYEAYQFFWNASLASPLIRFLHAHSVGFTLSGWSRETGTGKTTVCKAGIANFGDPSGVGQTADGQDGATEHALTLMTGIRHNLPVLVDEITGWDPKRTGKFLYRMANGTGKLQGSAEGGLRDTGKYNWNSVCYITANDPCAPIVANANRNSQAMLARIFDVKFAPVSFATEDSRVFEELWENTGNIGAHFVEYVVANQDKVKQLCEKNLAKMNALAGAGNEARYWMMFLAASVSALQIGKVLGLHQFDIGAIEKWALRRVKEMKIMSDNSIEDIEDTMAEIMSDLQSGMIVTLEEPDAARNRYVATPFAPGYGAPRTEVTGRYVANTGVVYIPTMIINKWCSEHSLDVFELKTKLEVKKWLVSAGERYQIGRGTSVATTRSRCWKLNWQNASGKLSVVMPNVSEEEGNQVAGA